MPRSGAFWVPAVLRALTLPFFAPCIAQTGTLCGFHAFNNDFRASIFPLDGFNATCLGYDPYTGCPPSFARRTICMTAWHDDPWADCIYTCIAM